jgi:digeranylgeranylglycerophospholipid reductase
MQEYETIIIGAGPAGLIAGKNLKKDFLILEKKKEVGKLVQCGEGISAQALKKQGIDPDSSWISSTIHRAKRTMPNSKSFGKWHQASLGYVIDRTLFEKNLSLLVKNHIKMDTEVEDLELKDNVWYVSTKNKEVFMAKHLIGADGSNSIVRRKIFPENKMEFFPAIEYLAEFGKELNVEEIEMFFDNNKYQEGYAWIFPKSKNKANVGVCGKSIKIETFNDFLKNSVEKKYGASSLLANKSGTIPIASPESQVFKDNAFLVGDAGGFADPFFKGGMSQGMFSAQIAVLCILENKGFEYKKRLTLSGILSQEIYQAAKTFYSFNNKVFNELGDVLENKGMLSYLKTFSGIKSFLLKKNLRRNSFNLYKFLKAWNKNRDYLW